MLSTQIEYAALHLAEYKLTRATLPHSTSADEFVGARFDDNMSKLAKSWKLQKPMPHRLRTASLLELSTMELDKLVRKLSEGQCVEATVSKGADCEKMELSGSPRLCVTICQYRRFTCWFLALQHQYCLCEFRFNGISFGEDYS